MNPISHVHFDAQQLPPEQRLAAWKSVMLGYDVSLPPGALATDFTVRSSSWLLDDFTVSRTAVSPVRLSRTFAHIRRDGIDTYNFVVMTDGSWTGRVGDRALTVGPGQLVLLDMTRPFETEASATESLIVVFRRAALDAMTTRELDLHGQIIGGVKGALLVDFFLLLAKHLPALSRDDLATVTRAALAQVAMIVGSIPDRSVAQHVGDKIRHLGRRYIERHLTDADLTPERLAREIGIARSTLYRSFQPLGGVAAYVRRRRIDAVRIRLIDGDERRTIAELAETFGFADASHLSAAFRQAYGTTPRAYRHSTNRRASPDGQQGVASFARFLAWKDELVGKPATKPLVSK